ncbi:MAG: AmmeMemoRadiSam system protein B [Candidatus Pacearchaeota archaeon]|nr:AmmeMemoRadiSam system protein B [Candidatus Pacearchaeota archaeon]
MRKAIVAGQFYSAEEEELKKQIESCFKNKFGPGGIKGLNLNNSKSPSIKLIRGLISPHAGYIFSGACASHGFSEFLKLKKENLPKTFILLGPNHSGHANSSFSLSLEDFETPLGIVKNNKELGKKLLEKCKSEGLIQDELAHKHEHSLEVQLPFLQYIYELKKTDFQIVPIVISANKYEDCTNLAESIAEVLKKINEKSKENVCIIASSDFTHFGSNYGFKPFSKNIKENLYSLDNKAIDSILQFNSKEFYGKAMETTICGTFGIIILIEILKKLGVKKSKLLKYYTSGDIIHEYDSAVGYASIIFY